MLIINIIIIVISILFWFHSVSLRKINKFILLLPTHVSSLYLTSDEIIRQPAFAYRAKSRTVTKYFREFYCMIAFLFFNFGGHRVSSSLALMPPRARWISLCAHRGDNQLFVNRGTPCRLTHTSVRWRERAAWAPHRRCRRVDKLIPRLKFNFAPRIIGIKRHFSFLLFEIVQGNRVDHFAKWTLETSLDIDHMRFHLLRENDLRKNFSPVFIVYVRRAFRESFVLLHGVVRRLSSITIRRVKEKEEGGRGQEVT